MTFAIVIISILSFNILLFCFLLMVENRSQITMMEAKSVAMSSGMTLGLASGLYLMYFLSEEITLATFIAMAIGSVVGIIISAPVHLLAAIEGLLAGSMGGMMGVMLGSMLPVQEWDLMMKLLLVMLVIILLVNVTYLYKRSEKKYPKTFRFIIGVTVILISTGMYSIMIFSGTGSHNEEVPPHHMNHVE
ncbi:hypothetical protein ACJROX_16360 [Pseudalkalibacillus sp. A8]|uniref:hypothetical protein n=1 Tax=Pseudalkalibacillus sp. A8 TaxID=3382641 RepID=UPI0038B6AD9B